MAIYPVDQTSSEMHGINFQGNVIPASWKCFIKHKGRPDLNAMFILSELIFWYRPVIMRDEDGREVLYKKYKADFLQKGYKQLQEATGLSEKQIREALERLEALGLIKRILRVIEVNIKDSKDVRKIPNVLFIQIFPEKIKQITNPEFKKEVSSFPTGNHGTSPQGTTNTEITNTEITEQQQAPASPPIPTASPSGCSFSAKKGKKEHSEDQTENQRSILLKEHGLNAQECSRFAYLSLDEAKLACEAFCQQKARNGSFSGKALLIHLLNIKAKPNAPSKEAVVKDKVLSDYERMELETANRHKAESLIKVNWKKLKPGCSVASHFNYFTITIDGRSEKHAYDTKGLSALTSFYKNPSWQAFLSP